MSKFRQESGRGARRSIWHRDRIENGQDEGQEGKNIGRRQEGGADGKEGVECRPYS